MQAGRGSKFHVKSKIPEKRDAFTAEKQAKSAERLFNAKCNDIIFHGIGVTQKKTVKRRTEQL